MDVPASFWEKLASGSASPVVWIIFSIIVICFFAKLIPGFWRQSLMTRKERMTDVVARRKRLDERIRQIEAGEVKCDAELLDFLRREQRVAVIDEFAGFHVRDNEIEAVLKLRATGKATMGEIRRAWDCLEVRDGEMHRRSYEFFDWLNMAGIALSTFVGIGSLILFSLTLLIHKPVYLCLLDAGIGFVMFLFLVYMARDFSAALCIDKRVYGTAKKEAAKE